MEKIYKKYFSNTCSVIYSYVKDRSTTQDLAQELYAKLWQKRADLQIDNLPAYLRKMAANQALMHLRKQRQVHQSTDDVIISSGVAADDQLIAQEMEGKIAFALQQLPPRCKEVFLLSRKEKLTYRQIASELNISVKTVENQMGKALRLLRSYLRT